MPRRGLRPHLRRRLCGKSGQARLVFVLLDGLCAAQAQSLMPVMRALEETGQARRTELEAALPPISRPIYATLFCGLTPLESGILHNERNLPCPRPNIFSKARERGQITAAAAYFWVAELLLGRAFQPLRERFQNDPKSHIQHGIYYWDDAYPDPELFADGEYLRQRFKPQLLFVHSMGIDNAGHRHGANSEEYKGAVRGADSLLAVYLPLWLQAGYQVLVTSDHGIQADKSHYACSEEARLVPLWLVGSAMALPSAQTDIAALVDALLA